MNEVTEKVLQRLAYEKLLLVVGVAPRKRRIILKDVFAAAKQEPRILEVLPAILLFSPKIIFGVEKDLKRKPQLKQFAENALDATAIKKEFFGIPIEDCRKAALTYKAYLTHRRRHNRDRLFNLRLSEQDWNRLQQLSRTLGTHNHSETIRRLIEERYET